MKKLLLPVLLLFTQYTFAQISIGLTVNPGFGRLNSKSLNDYYDSLERKDSVITRAQASSRLRFNFGIGAFVEYKFSAKLTGAIEPTFNVLKSEYHFFNKTTEVDDKGNGFSFKTDSRAKVNLYYLNLPFIARYTLNENKRYFIASGIGLNFNIANKLRSQEQYAYSTYLNNEIQPNEVINTAGKAKLSQNLLNVNFILGVGKTLRLYNKVLHASLRYNLPLTKSSLASQDPANSSSMAWMFSKNSNVGFNNFKIAVISFSLQLPLYKP